MTTPNIKFKILPSAISPNASLQDNRYSQPVAHAQTCGSRSDYQESLEQSYMISKSSPMLKYSSLSPTKNRSLIRSEPIDSTANRSSILRKPSSYLQEHISPLTSPPTLNLRTPPLLKKKKKKKPTFPRRIQRLHIKNINPLHLPQKLQSFQSSGLLQIGRHRTRQGARGQ